MARMLHGGSIPLEGGGRAAARLRRRSAAVTMHFAPAQALAADYHQYGFLLPDLQQNADNLLPESSQMPRWLIDLGRTMLDPDDGPENDTDIPALYTYFGQFVDHDITLDAVSASLPELFDADLAPLSQEKIRRSLHNRRTGSLDLDSIYGPPAERVGERMRLGKVTTRRGQRPPFLRPRGKDIYNDLPRQPPADAIELDRAALIGDPRNDENTIISQLHLAFLRAHNALIRQGHSFVEASTRLRQHYQYLVLHDFLKQIADPQIVDSAIAAQVGSSDTSGEPFFVPLEFTVAAFRFGHSMVRAQYDFNLNFNRSGRAPVLPATLGSLFTFTALAGELGDFKTLPDNWIIEWEHFIEGGANKARRIDTRLVEPLFQLRNLVGAPLPGDEARLAVRNLLRGYLLRMPTGQAVARALGQPVLSAHQIHAAAASDDQRLALAAGGFLERTPLWYYLLAEAAQSGGQRLGPVGSMLVAQVLASLVRRSQDSILRTPGWQPTLPARTPGAYRVSDLLALAGVLAS